MTSASQEINVFSVRSSSVDEQAAMEILGMIGRRTWKNDDKNGCTVHSAVYNLTDKTMMWIPNENFDDSSAVFEFGFEN